MAMNLRLNETQETALTWLAKCEGISKNEAAARAIEDRADRLAHDSRVERIAREGIDKYAGLLARLADS